MTTTTSSIHALVSFLLARIEDDESNARRSSRTAARATSPRPTDDPWARVRAECLAKRKVIGAAQQLLVLRDQPHERIIREQARQVLYALAIPHHDHPEYRREWA